jgi:hypothetical protein
MFLEETFHIRRKFECKKAFCSELANKAPKNSDVLNVPLSFLVTTTLVAEYHTLDMSVLLREGK